MLQIILDNSSRFSRSLLSGPNQATSNHTTGLRIQTNKLAHMLSINQNLEVTLTSQNNQHKVNLPSHNSQHKVTLTSHNPELNTNI